jgi:8-oxo-dGTP pyrophosphatase MutT (NUDIX family)
VIEAAGILFIAPGDKALFLSRAPSQSGMAGLWDFPGGKAEDLDADLKATAIRECKEETSHVVKPDDITLHTRRQREGIDYTIYICRVAAEFTPKLDNEHDGYAWTPILKPPTPLHPGCAVALYRFSTDELGVARLIAAGELMSPQKYENVWLFDVRVTGTGVAYRNKLDEFAHRPPEEYLNSEFLARCNGLPVIWKHPEEATLNSEEFSKRVVGTVFLPYIGDGVRHPAEDVWAIAKIHDEEAAKRMQAEQLSTSPGVVLKKEDIKDKMELANGSTLLLEGKPYLLDHLAICEVGVWDKGNAPTGVVRGDDNMVNGTGMTARNDADVEKLERKADAGPVTVDKLLECVDSLAKRMDAFEEEEEKTMDARRKDGQTAGADFEKDRGTKLDDDDDDDDGDDDDRRADRRRGDSRRRKDGEEEDFEFRDSSRRRKDGEEEDFEFRDSSRRRKDGEEEDFEFGDSSRRRKDGEEEDFEFGDSSRRRKDARRHDIRRRDARRHDDDGARAGDMRVSRAQFDTMVREMDALKARLPKAMSDTDWHDLHAAQARADSVYGAFGANIRAPRPLDGEGLFNYRRRLADGLKKHSARWKDIDLYAVNDAAMPNVETDVYNDAMVVARNPSDIGEGELRPHRRVLESGHMQIEFYGKPSSWLDQFAGSRRRLAGIRTKSN